MKKIAIAGLGVVIFILILLGVTFLESLKNRDAIEQETTPTPARTTTQRRIQDPLVNYNKKSSDKLLEIVESRPTPGAPSDKNLRAQLISELDNQSGIIQNTASYRLEYVASPDSFEVEIKTSEITKAKDEAILYLKTRGFTEDGICKLPLMFYVNHEVAKNMKSGEDEFNQIPDFCL
jgi:hypothetical protein